jgi:hypothetical protein
VARPVLGQGGQRRAQRADHAGRCTQLSGPNHPSSPPPACELDPSRASPPVFCACLCPCPGESVDCYFWIHWQLLLDPLFFQSPGGRLHNARLQAQPGATPGGWVCMCGGWNGGRAVWPWLGPWSDSCQEGRGVQPSRQASGRCAASRQRMLHRMLKQSA